MKWFKHETNASQDAKLKKIRMKYGMEGLGLYWYCLELIGSCVESHNLTFELEHDSEIISADTGIHYEVVQEMMTYMISLGLFEQNGVIITCLKMAIRADEYTQKHLKKADNIPLLSRQTPDNIPTISRQSRDKVRSIRKKERKKDNRARFTPPTSEEVQKYLDEKGITAFTGETFVNHYESVGWMRGKTKIKSWKHCVNTWKSNSRDQKSESFGAGGI